MKFAVLLSLATSILASPIKLDCVFEAETYPVQSCDLSNLPYSCSANPPSGQQCCYENYGYIMQTQFWDYNADYLKQATSGDTEAIANLSMTIKKSDSTAASKTFTIHGLWNDLCDGSYKQFCEPDLELDENQDMKALIVDTFNKPDLYETMNTYWLNSGASSFDGSNYSFWIHEYNKHGTCYNTLEPSCFTGDYKTHENAVYFYQKVVEVWEPLTTYQFLANAGIVPSVKEQYALSDVQQALKSKFGKEVYIGCQDGAINEIWYYHYLKGNVLTGELKPTDALTQTKCPDQVWYIPK